MKNRFALILVYLTALLLVYPSLANSSGKKPGGSSSGTTSILTSLQGTTWSGDITLVDSGGTTTTVSGAVLTVSTQTSTTFISGTITDPNDSTATLPFSGIVTPGGSGGDVQITVTDILIRACVVKTPGSGSTVVMNVIGSDLSKGSSFSGQLTQQ